MTSYVALLRGINVGGNTRVKMSDLVEIFEALGYANVSTYLNSGNVLFSSTDDHGHREKIEKALQEKLGLSLCVMIKTKEELELVVAQNPFNDEIIESDRTLFVSFLFDILSKESQEVLRDLSNEDEQLVPFTHMVYTLLVRAHFPKSNMSKNILLRQLKVDSTARNWNTITNLIARM